MQYIRFTTIYFLILHAFCGVGMETEYHGNTRLIAMNSEDMIVSCHNNSSIFTGIVQ